MSDGTIRKRLMSWSIAAPMRPPKSVSYTHLTLPTTPYV